MERERERAWKSLMEEVERSNGERDRERGRGREGGREREGGWEGEGGRVGGREREGRRELDRWKGQRG